MKGKHEKKQFSALLALALCAMLVVTFMPNLMFRANAEENAKSADVQSFNSIGDTALEADSAESAQTKVSSTYATVTGTVSEDGSEKTDVSIPVKWTQDTAKSSDSSYVFQAQLKDEDNKDTDGDGTIYSLKDSSVTLPEVSVKKSEKKDANVANSNKDNGQSSKCKSDNTDNTRDQYSYEDKYIKVSARLTDAEAISDHAELKVNAINKDTKKYAAYLHKLNASEKSKYVNCLLYDISFIENGKEVEPDSGHVQLQVKFKNRQLTKQLGVESADDLSVIHFINDDSSKKHMQTLKSNTKLHNQTVSFSTTSFSTFAFKSDEGQKNTWTGSADITFDQVQSALQGTDNFAVYANKLIQGSHLEGNVKVRVLDAVNSGALVNQDNSVISRNKIASIKVVKNVSPALEQDQTFKFGIYKKENNQYTRVGQPISVVIKQGKTSGSSEITDGDVINEINKDSLHTYYVFELNDEQSPIIVDSSTATIGGKQFNVSYQGNEIIPPGNASNFTNYIGSISNGNNTTANLEMQYFYDNDYNRMTYIEDFKNPQQERTHLTFESAGTIVDIANYYNNENKFDNIQQQSGIKEDINKKLNTLQTFSSTLANAKNGAKSGEGALSVINLKSTTGKLSTDLDNANFESVVNGVGIKDTINNGEYLLINIDVGSYTEYKLDKIMIDGYDPDNNNEELARHVILNFVKSNDSGGFTAYDGKISFENVSAGLLLAPAANVYQDGGFRGQVIANTFDRTRGTETHKNVITKPVNRVVAVSNSPVGSEINKINLTVNKVWKDNDNQDGKRPASIQVQLYADGQASGKPETLTAADQWTHTWNNLLVKNSDGTPITYTVQELNTLSDYTSDVTGDASSGFTITNTHTPETTSVSGTKTWDDNGNQDGKRPNSINLRLYADGTEVKSKAPIINKNGNEWSYSFTDLPKYKDGKEIKYTVTEDAVADYSTKVDGYTITNSYTPGKTSVTVTKAWEDNNNADNKRPASIQVQLYANGEKSGDPVTITANDKNAWTYTWKDLPEKQSGKSIQYAVKEVNTPKGYKSQVTGDAKTGYTITNTEEKTTPPTPVTPTTTTCTVHKVWNLDDGRTAASSVQVQLYKNGKADGDPVTLNAGNGWSHEWTGLDKTDEQGKTISWTVDEVKVPNGFTHKVSGSDNKYTIINDDKPDTPTPVTPTTTTCTVHKVWNLDDGRTAASSVQAQLYRNGEAYGDPVTLSAGNHWSYLWTGLTKTDAQGNTISWTVREVNVPSGFTSTVTGTDRSFTITNDDKPQDNHNKHNNSEHPNNHNNNKNNKPVHPSNHNKNNTTVHPGTPTIPKNTGKTAVHHGIAAGGTPRTGDQTSLGFWLAMLLAGAAGTAAALLFKRRNRKEEE